MAKYERVSQITRRDGLLTTERRAATNFAAWRGGIHGEGEAQKAGFRGGLVSGLIHNEQFVPLAVEAFGKEWFERGFYSLYYRTPVYDQDEVQAFIRDPGLRREDAQVEAWSETPEGVHVAEGNIGMGTPDEPTALRRRFEGTRVDPSELTLLRDVVPGEPLEGGIRCFPLLPGPPVKGVAPRPGGEGQLQRRENTTEPLDWYFGDSPWGKPVAGSLAIQRLMRPSLGPILARRRAEVIEGAAAGADGGIEVHFVNGPIFLDKDYGVSGTVLGVSQSPRAENLWWESQLEDLETGKIVARMLMMSRWFKHTHA